MRRKLKLADHPWFQISYRVFTVFWMIADLCINGTFAHHIDNMHNGLIVSAVCMIIGYALIQWYWVGFVFDFGYMYFQTLPYFNLVGPLDVVAWVLSIVLILVVIIHFSGTKELRKSALRKRWKTNLILIPLTIVIIGFIMGSITAIFVFANYSSEEVRMGAVKDISIDSRTDGGVVLVTSIDDATTTSYQVSLLIQHISVGDTVHIHKLVKPGLFEAEYITDINDKYH